MEDPRKLNLMQQVSWKEGKAAEMKVGIIVQYEALGL
jgi:hypothetical protein